MLRWQETEVVGEPEILFRAGQVPPELASEEWAAGDYSKGYRVKVATALIFVLNVGLLAALLYLFLSNGYVASPGFSGYELVTVVLSALAVLLTALGIFIALLAVWGYTSLKNLARERAETVAAATASEEVGRRVPGLVAAEMSARFGEYDYGEAASAESDYDVRD